MRKLRLVLLRHLSSQGDHYDLMLEEPAGTESGAAGTPDGERSTEGPDDRVLVTFRVESPFWEWESGAPLTMRRLGAHRRVYLTFEGEISGGRGSVRRVVEGFAVAMEWSDDRAVLKVEWARGAICGGGTLTLKQTVGDQWVGRWEVERV